MNPPAKVVRFRKEADVWLPLDIIGRAALLSICWRSWFPHTQLDYITTTLSRAGYRIELIDPEDLINDV